MPWDNIPLINDIPLDLRVTITRVFIAIIAFIIIWLLRHIVTRVLARPFKNAADKTNTPMDDHIIDTIAGASFYIVTGIGILIAEIIIALSGDVGVFFQHLGFSFIIFGIAKLVYDATAQLTESESYVRRYAGVDISREILPLLRITLKLLVIIITLMVMLQIWNINIAGLLAGVGLGGLAISLAAKEILDDVLGFVIIMTDKPFKLDEYIITPHGEGIIERIGIRATYIRRLDQGLTIVPNSTIANDPMTNWSRLEQRWFNFMIGVTYDSTAEQIENLAQKLRKLLRGREKIKEDSVVVAFTEYDDSSLNLLVRCYVDIADWTDSKIERHAVNLEIRRLVDDLDMNIAFPSRSLYLEHMPAGITQSNGNSNSTTSNQKQLNGKQSGKQNGSTFHDDNENAEIHSAEEADYSDSD
ncbi:MAG: mechanosensitive ion channel family protein [Aggregatilineales bacterium]